MSSITEEAKLRVQPRSSDEVPAHVFTLLARKNGGLAQNRFDPQFSKPGNEWVLDLDHRWPLMVRDTVWTINASTSLRIMVWLHQPNCGPARSKCSRHEARLRDFTQAAKPLLDRESRSSSTNSTASSFSTAYLSLPSTVVKIARTTTEVLLSFSTASPIAYFPMHPSSPSLW